MQNIDIKNFTTVSSVENFDHVVLSLFGGSSAKMTVSLFRDILVRGISPSVGEDGTWYIGEAATGITAEGKTPELRKGLEGIEYKYTTESDTMWRLLVSYADLRLKYEDLTDEQIASLKLTFNDLTEEDIAILQQPATETIAKLEETNKNVQEAEILRVEAEDSRVFAETSRADAEIKRVETELARIEAEKTRVSEHNKLKAESEEATANAIKAATEAKYVPEIRNGDWWVYNIEQAAYVDTGLTALGKSPLIINGTWWIWNDSTDAFEDTGQSVNTDYQLTKEKVEGVFQGNIDTHWHDRYVDKVEGMGLSETSFTQAEKDYLATLHNYDDTGLKNRVEEVADAIPTQVSQLENDSQYVTETALTAKKYATEDDLNKGVESLQEEVATKQAKNVYFTNVEAVNWIREDVYRDYPYRCDLVCEGVTASDYAEIVFGMDESITGYYAPLCETKAGIVSVWSTVDKAIIIPTVIINKG